MVFSSHYFVFYFLPLALLSYYLLPRRARHLGLTFLSYFFYGWANPAFVLLMIFSTVVDYFCGLWIGDRTEATASEAQLAPPPKRLRDMKVAVGISVATNLSLLGFFKYFNFAVDNYNGLIAALGLEAFAWETILRVTLPLGISFYTFQSMSYTIDVYRGHAKPLRNFIDFACYVSMFPQLVAGPIIRFQEVADQFRQRTHTLEKFSLGAAFFSVGMGKKILLANPCGKIADTVFDAGSAGIFDAWFGVTAYAFQIYFDFSGYSDMAIGLGLMLGFVFPKNFDSPYHAQSITDFWRRWHMSLSRWLRDYLYIPLGGNRLGPQRTYVNLMLVMLLGGLWHGASWNFVIWGGIHGGMLAMERLRGKESFYNRLPNYARIAATFVVVLISWVFFRAETLPQAASYLASMFGMLVPQEGAGLIGGIIYQPYYVLAFATAVLVVWLAPQTWDWVRKLTPVKVVASIGVLWLSLIAMTTQEFNPFIYFIF